MRDTHVIVGAGLAGAKAAETLREQGFDGRVVLVGAEPEAPYERPPLSKAYLRGEASREEARVHPPGFYADRDIELLTGTAVEAVDLSARAVELSGGARIPFDRLLLATGSEPRPLPVPGADLDGVHLLRDLADADALAARLAGGGRMVAIGAGWIGLEVAACARQAGVEAAIIEHVAATLERVLGRRAGYLFAAVHRAHGAELHTGAAVVAVEGAGRVERVRLADGRALDCDLVVAGVGVTPRTELARAGGIAVDDGIGVSERLETSAPGVFAAGDAASMMHPFYGRRLRVEHWANALNQGPAAARAMLGEPVSYDRLPYFYSDQFDVGMEYTGHAARWDEVVLRGDPAAPELIAFWLDRGRVVAGMNVNVWGVTDAIEALIRSSLPVAAERLRDPGVPLEELAGVPGAEAA